MFFVFWDGRFTGPDIPGPNLPSYHLKCFMLILNVYLFQQEKYRKTQQLLRDILSVKFSAVFKSKSEVVLIFKEVPLIFILEIEVKQMSHLEVTNSTAAGSVICT